MSEQRRNQWCGWPIALAVLLLWTATHGERPILVRGSVYDSQTGQPVEEAAVRVGGLTLGTTTDTNGVFRLTLPTGEYDLTFSRIGYRSSRRTITPDSNQVLRVELVPKVLRLQGIDVLAGSPGTRFEELQESAGALSGADLERNYSLTLAETIRNEVGVGIRSMGPAPARPVIRGLSGDRVQITQDGIQTRDLSSTSADHAVTLEMFNLERIEIIRGPRTLLHGSSASGGVVNVVKRKIPETRPNQVYGSTGLSGSTADRGGLSAVSFNAPMGPFGVFGEATYRTTQDLATPIGKLANTQIRTHTVIAGLSRAGESGYVGISFDQFDTEYGIPGGFIGSHPNGVDIDIVRRIFDAKAVYRFDAGILDRLETSFARTFYHHFEFESNGNIGSEFLFHNYAGNAEFHIGEGRTKGIVSVAADHHDLELGAFVFTPPTRRWSGTLSAYYETSRDRFELQAAARYTHSEFHPRGEEDLQRTFNAWSAAVSPLVLISDKLVGGFSISRSERVPTIEELYSDGPHLAAYTFEVGDSSLEAERNTGAEMFLHFRQPGLDLLLTGFWNEYGNFLTPRNTGDMNFALLLPIYAVDGVRARFLGMESQLTAHSGTLLGEIGISYVRGQNRDDGIPLPEIPPLRVRGALEYRHPWLTLGITGEHARRQGRVDTFEAPTNGYSIFGCYAQKDLVSGHFRHSLAVSLDNAADTEYRNHLSRVRSVMPETGRSVKLNYRIHYF